MDSKAFRIEAVNDGNIRTWFESAAKCDYAPYNALDEKLGDLYLRKGLCGSVMVFENGNPAPVALLQGEVIKKNAGPFSLRIFSSKYGGLLLCREPKERDALKVFTVNSLAGDYLTRRLKIDYIDMILPPLISIERPQMADKLLPFFQGQVEINSLLFARLEEGLLDRLSYNVKRETIKGLEILRTSKILRAGDPGIIDALADLEKQKAEFLHIEPVSRSHFERVLDPAGVYRAAVAVIGERPSCAVIYTICNGVSTFHHNASIGADRKTFANKGLLFNCMQEAKQEGAKYFVLGNGWERPKTGSEAGQLSKMTFFKRSFATDEVASPRYFCPLTNKGRLATALRRFKKTL